MYDTVFPTAGARAGQRLLGRLLSAGHWCVWPVDGGEAVLGFPKNGRALILACGEVEDVSVR